MSKLRLKAVAVVFVRLLNSRSPEETLVTFVFSKAGRGPLATRYKKKRIGTSGAKSLTVEKIEGYIAEYSQSHDIEFNVWAVDISPILPPSSENKKDWQIFQNCFGRKDTKHHAYLKWFSYHFIKQNAAELMDLEVRMETNVYMPNPAYTNNYSVRNYGRLLRKEEFIHIGNDFGREHGPEGWIQEADITCQSSFIVECGDTSPLSLAMPIITLAASKVVWLPHKVAGKYRNEEWTDFATPLKAFIISRPN